MRNKRRASDRQNETYNQVSERETARNSKGGFRQFPLGRIRPSPHNARTHSAKQIRQIANSIAAFGFTNPLLVSEDIEVIAGHGRYEAAKLLGLPNAPVIIIPGLSPARRRALAIADNKIAANAGWDRERLAIEIPELIELLSTEGLDISILGFEPVEIEQIRIEPEKPAAGSRDDARSHDDVDATWGRVAAVSRSGDLWILDTHKLLCGDARSTDDLKLVMGADRADMAFVDLGDDKRAGDAEDDVRRALDAAAAVSREGAVHFVCTNWAGVGELAATAKEAGRRVLDVVVWVAPEPSQGAMYRDQYEPVGVLEIGPSERCETQGRRARRARSNVWRYPSATSLPLTFSDALRRSARLVPVALVADAIKDCTRRNDVILDPFCGAGTTIMAAQRLGRRARCAEREPLLVDVTIRRWQAATGRHALHAESRLPFNSIEAKRSRKHDGWER
jgi:ParB-like nuclease domain/DNA methylase